MDQSQIFNRKSISRNATHRKSLNVIQIEISALLFEEDLKTDDAQCYVKSISY